MARRLKAQRGQSILEYLVIVTVIIVAIIAVRATVAGNMKKLYDEAAKQTDKASTELAGLSSGGTPGTPGGPTSGPGGPVF